MSFRPTRTPARSISVTVKHFFDLIDEHHIGQAALRQVTGHASNTVFYWRRGHRMPNVWDFERLVDAAGFRLAIVPKEPD
jgi:hypothetical protein